MAKAWVVWNEDRTEGVVFTDPTDGPRDARRCAQGVTDSGSSLGCAFADLYDDQELTLQEIEIENDKAN